MKLIRFVNFSVLMSVALLLAPVGLAVPITNFQQRAATVPGRVLIPVEESVEFRKIGAG
jgi:hypothetical protein